MFRLRNKKIKFSLPKVLPVYKYSLFQWQPRPNNFLQGIADLPAYICFALGEANDGSPAEIASKAPLVGANKVIEPPANIV